MNSNQNNFCILVAVLVTSFMLAGCHSEPEVVETQASKDMAVAAASAWTPEKIKIFAEENKKARAGLDDGPIGATAPGVAAPGSRTK